MIAHLKMKKVILSKKNNCANHISKDKNIEKNIYNSKPTMSQCFVQVISIITTWIIPYVYIANIIFHLNFKFNNRKVVTAACYTFLCKLFVDFVFFLRSMVHS